MHTKSVSFTKALSAIAAIILCFFCVSLQAQVDIPASAAVSGPALVPGGSLKGEYWHRPTASIFTDGTTVPAHRVDTQINGFGTADATFTATGFVYLGNDLTPVLTWLGADAASFVGTPNNLDDAAIRLRGFINRPTAGVLSLGTISDDGARITIAGIDITNGDGSHGDETHDADVNFLAAGVYPIEVTYFAGDWTSDSLPAPAPPNHSGSLDPGLHGGDNFHLRIGGADVNSTTARILFPTAPPVITTTTLLTPAGRAWAYNDTTATPGLTGAWTTPGYDTNSEPGWKTGTSLFGNDATGIYDTASQPFAGRGVNGFETLLDRFLSADDTGNADRITFYFRTKFNWTGPTAGVSLTASNWVDDGIVVYLNGTEVSRIRIADGPVTWDTLGANPGTEGLVEVRTWDGSALVAGENTIAVELHQSGANSSDAAFAIGLQAVSPLTPTITNPDQPADRSVFANATTTLTVEAIASPAPTYQWYHDGVAIDASINPSAATASYTIPVMQATDAGNYFARVANVLGSVDSRTAAVAYNNDTTPPIVVEVGGSATFDRISVLYDGLVDPGTAGDAFNYTLSGGLSADTVTLNADGKSVVIKLLGLMAPDTVYSVTVENVKDLANNTIPLGGITTSFRSWVTGWCSGVNMATYPGGGTAVSGMTSLPIYPNSPDFRTFLSVLDIRTAVDPANPTFYSTDARENYGGRLTGYYMASESGPHTFYFASDDNGEFWLSTDERPAHKVMVARESAWSNTKEWGISGGSSLLTSSATTKGKKSLPVNLTAGHAYYFEALYKEGGGGDNCAVAVQLPSQSTPPVDGADAIGATSLGTVAPANFFGPIVIGTEPADQTVAENALVTISVVLSGPAFDGQLVPVCYQWRRGGVPIPGANLSSYTLGLATTADDGATFDCTLGISGANAVTRTATLHVVSDIIPPACVSAAGGSTSSNLVVRFSEIVSTGTAEDLFNYTVTGLANIPVVGAVRQAGGSNVVLTVEGVLEAGRNYSVHVDNVADLSGNPVPAPGCDLAFSISSAGGYSAVVLADNPIAYWRYNDAPPTAINAGSLGAAAAGTYHGGATPGSEAPKPPLFPGLEPGNTALQCNGTDAFMGTTVSLLNSRPVFTISGWIRRDGDQNNRTGLWGQNDIVEFGYIANQTLEAWTDNGLDIPNAIPNGEWAHLAIVSDGSPGTISMYTNGVLAGSRSHTLPADNAFMFNVGGGGVFDDGVANGNFFKGQIDEVAVFGTALPAAKILAQYHSALVSPGYSFDDGFLPAGTIASGTTPPYVQNGVLHLSDQVNSQANYWTIPLDSTVTYQTLTARWRTKIEGVGGADGISFNAGQNVGTSFTPEDGGGSGLSVCIDTYNNGLGDAGLDIKWNGATLTHLPVPAAGGADGSGAPAELAIGSFVDTTVDVTASGHVTFRYATMVIEADIPGYAGLTANMYVFAARTGGANENAWIDDVIIRGETLPGPTITTQPADQSVAVGATATFSVVANGTAPLAYQWSRKLSGEASFTPIAGATTASYTTAATAYPADDLAQFKVQVSDANGTANSGPATLHVIPPGTAVVLWTVGKKDGGWPAGDGGGANATFVQENGSIQPLPGSPTSPEVDQQADNDYYFAGDYSTAIDSVVALYGAYTPLGPVAANEEAAERAFAGGDLDLRYHFNLPATLLPTDQISVTFSAINLDSPGAVNTDPRFGAEVYFNGVKIQDQILIRAPQLNVDYTTPRFSLASVNAKTGSGFDNVVSLKGISYNSDGGGNWMGIDYVQLNTIHIAAPQSVQVVSVASRCEPNIIHVKYNHAVLLDGEYTYSAGFVAGLSYGADHSEVLVETDPLPPNADIELTIANVHDESGNVIDPNPTISKFTHGFGATTADFAGGTVPAGTIAQGTTPPAVGAEGGLHLTDLGIGTQQNYWTIPLGGGTFTLDRIQAKWRTLLGGLGQADGFSFNVGESATPGTPFTYVAGVNEEGSTVGLSVTIDTYDNGEMNPGSSDVGLEVRWNGVRLSYTAVGGGHANGPAELMTGTFVDTSVDLTPSGLVTFTHGAYSTTAQIPGFTGIRVNQYEFAARTGGAAEDCWIDDVHINDFNLTGPTIGSGPNDVTTPENTTATFAVTGVGGIVPIAYQWLRNGVAIAGANGPSYSLSAVTSADNGAKFSVRLANDCGVATSREATLTVVSAPVALSASSRGNCHAIYITYNKDVLLDGTYSVVCSNSATPVVLLNQDFNAGDGGFTVATPLAFDGPWTYDAAGGRWSENGQATDNAHANTTILTSPAINVTQAGVVQLTFAHRYSFEGGNWDGGQIRVSVNGGAFTAVPASAFSQNGYNGKVAANSQSDLHDQDSFVNNSPNYTGGTIVSSCSLGVLNAGDTVRVQFFASSDSNTRGPNEPQWDLDSLQVASYSVSAITITGAFYGEAQNVVCLRLPTDLVADVNTYRVLITGVHDAAGAVISPNPTLKTFVHGAEYPLFSILEKRFDGIGGVNVSDLTSNPKFPNHPDLVLRDPTAFFEVPANVSGNYGVQLLGWAVAPATADYRFWVSSDDLSVLYLADDGMPSHKRQIAMEPQWNGERQYATCDRRTCVDNIPQETQSAPIHLTAGQVIYLEGLMKEGGGGDNFSVAATLSDPTPPANGSSPISIQYFQPRRLGPNGEIFTRVCDVFCYAGPSDQTAFIGQSATFEFVPDGTPPWTIQWKKNGTDIPGANGVTYTTPPVTAADNGAVYTVALGNAFSSTTCTATLHVRPDPRVVDCFAKCDAGTIHVLFNKPVRLDGTYTLSSGFVTGVAYGSSHAEVLVSGDPLAPESTATLTIADVHSEDGFVLVPNPSTCVVSYGVGRFCVDFNDGLVPAGTTSSGTTPPYVGTEGALHLTDAANSQGNYWTIPLSGTRTFPLFSAKWRTFLEGVGGADGMSFNAGVNLGTGFTPEEGAGNGLSVQIDTYNNGAADTGIEIKWNGSRIGFLPVGPGVDGQGSPAELALAQWADTSVEVTPSGLVTFKYATYVITGQIPSFSGLNANMYVFAGRTGGANENAWIDDVCIQPFTQGAPSIATQPADATIAQECVDSATFTAVINGTPPYNVQWLSNGVVVASINGSVSAVQSYTTSPLCRDADGAHYQVVVGNECGSVTSRGALVTVTFACDATDTTPPVVTCPPNITAQADPATQCAIVTYTVTATDDCHLKGGVVCTPPSGSCQPVGTHTVTCTATDAAGNIGRCSFTVTVGTGSLPPIAVISSEQLINLKPEFENPVLLSCNWWNACLVADGWSSSDPEGGVLTYLWFSDQDPVPVGAGPVVTNCVEVGTHVITLVVTDPTGLTGTDSKTIEVVTAPLAIDLLIEQINTAHKSGIVISRKLERELTATLRVALGFAGDEKLRQTQKALDTFEKKVRAEVAKGTLDATVGANWIRWSQAVSAGMEGCIKPPRKPKHDEDPDPKDPRK